MQAYLLQGQPPLLVPRNPGIRVPTSPEDTRQCVLDALATTTPREARMRIFKQWHDIIICSYVYKGGELMVIVRTRSTDPRHVPKYNIASHLLHNSLHLGSHLLPLSMVCARESVYKCVQVYADMREYLLNDGLLLTHVPLPLRSVFPLSPVSFACAKLFIGEFHTCSGFLFKLSCHAWSFRAPSSIPPEMVFVFMGRRHYKEHQCPRSCPCRWDRYRVCTDAIARNVQAIPLIVPSIIDGYARVMFAELEHRIRASPGSLFLNDLV